MVIATIKVVFPGLNEPPSLRVFGDKRIESIAIRLDLFGEGGKRLGDGRGRRDEEVTNAREERYGRREATKEKERDDLNEKEGRF